MIFPHICSRARLHAASAQLAATRRPTTVAFNTMQLKLRCIKDLQIRISHIVTTYASVLNLTLSGNSYCQTYFTKSSRSENFSSIAHTFLVNLQDNNPATGICLGVIRVTGDGKAFSHKLMSLYER